MSKQLVRQEPKVFFLFLPFHQSFLQASGNSPSVCIGRKEIVFLVKIVLAVSFLTLKKDKHFWLMFAWKIYLFMTNSCDVKWKTIMGFLGTFPGRFNGDKSFSVKERQRNLSESDDGFSAKMSLKRNCPKLSSFDHRSIIHSLPLCLRLELASLALFQLCKWTPLLAHDKNQSKKAIYVLLC